MIVDKTPPVKFDLVLFNKPFNVLCQFTDPNNRPTLADFITIKNYYVAGRLDRDSEGLCILTNHGPLQHLISHPKFKLVKTYWVQVEGKPENHELQPIRTGINLKDGLCKPCQVKIIKEPKIWDRDPPIRHRAAIPTTWLEIGLTEGRNRQVRRMTAACGFPTLRLIRQQIGGWNIDAIEPGSHNLVRLSLEQLPKNWQQYLSQAKSQKTQKKYQPASKKKYRHLSQRQHNVK